jgi:hypothetical protein
MSLYCPIYTLTWYPGAWPSTASPLALQSADHFADAYAGLGGAVEDQVQVAQFHRGESPDFYNRGNRQSLLDWEEVRRFDDPGEALTAGLRIIAEMPKVSGWLSILIPSEGTAFVATTCMIRSSRFPAVIKAGAEHLLRLRWALECGPITEIATTTEDGALTSEIGVALLTEAGDYLALQALT